MKLCEAILKTRHCPAPDSIDNQPGLLYHSPIHVSEGIMRRKDKEIKDKKEIEQIIAQARVCHLALADQGQPYLVPLNFGYRGGTVFFHSCSESPPV